LKVYWSSLDDFLAMGGYGPYVWGSFGMVALAIAVELWALRQRRKALAMENEPS
jgi:heme exporter protein D